MNRLRDPSRRLKARQSDSSAGSYTLRRLAPASAPEPSSITLALEEDRSPSIMALALRNNPAEIEK